MHVLESCCNAPQNLDRSNKETSKDLENTARGNKHDSNSNEKVNLFKLDCIHRYKVTMFAGPLLNEN